MATTLGKRKRRATEKGLDTREGSNKESTCPEVDAQELFRRHFEAKFKPLPVVKKVEEVIVVQEDDSEDDSDWDGISDDDQGAVEVVEHSDFESRLALMSKEELKAFMSSKPPSSTTITSTTLSKVVSSADEDDASETANLKKDLELQRFLKESHLLESATDHSFSGKNRQKATDLRLQALGSKTSILKQEKMPMSHRKGIIAKQNEREEKRRKEAKENGIILEKAKMVTKKGNEGKRDRGIGAPGVGRFSGGTLKLSKKDIFDVEGPKRSGSSRGGRGGGRGRGRGGERGKRGR
ncbi:Forty S assembly factor [Hyphodiscus hymeniophilus]|uniref:Forty S assembly factor n=1 Tax=Hyphodiscus hymeniophilus TaxID=353542 RepID=A0A9P7B0P5_9HELO|nr:Forty S assembly factor [Hyphodiscus hymeniophilus]